MINEPIAISARDFQHAWLQVIHYLKAKSWAVRNLMVQISEPSVIDFDFHNKIDKFAKDRGILSPKQVAYTIFPHGLYKSDSAQLFLDYNKPHGMYDKLKRKKKVGWGNYFYRMTHYDNNGVIVNQLENIIHAIRTRQKLNKATFTIVIQHPGPETLRPRGGPCLNYLAVQIEPSSDEFILGLLAVYRNHDFQGKAYGNYWGLCNLINFLSKEVGAKAGPLTCVSSRAYIEGPSSHLRTLVESM